MPDSTFIRCPGCRDAIFEASLTACPGCGRCPHCGKRRIKEEISDCPNCELPYCGCCGRCPQCDRRRYAEVPADCECGHPHNVAQLEELIDRETATGTTSRSSGSGCLTVLAGLLLLVLPLVFVLNR